MEEVRDPSLERDFWERRFDRPDDDGSPPRRGAPVGGRRRPPTRPRPTYDDRWHTRLLEWLRDRRGDPRLGVLALVLVAVVAGFIWYRIGVDGDDAGATPPAPRAAAASGGGERTDDGPRASDADGSDGAEAAGDDGEDGPMVVHVAGAVVRPGVVELPSSARVIDAVEAVGGATPEGDLDRLNLAAEVADGARVYVPVKGQADPGVLGAAAVGAPSDGSPGATATPSPAAKLDLNTATQAQLEALPGIGPAYAQAILAERERRGRFGSVNELREVRGIGDQRFADLEPLVTV